MLVFLGNRREWNGSDMVEVENKTLQWFGAALSASSTTEMIVVCIVYNHF